MSGDKWLRVTDVDAGIAPHNWPTLRLELELMEAARRVGDDPSAQLGWLQDFAAQDLSALPVRNRLQLEAGLFVGSVAALVSIGGDTRKDGHSSLVGNGPFRDFHLIEDLPDAQVTLRHWFESLRKDGHFRIARCLIRDVVLVRDVWPPGRESPIRLRARGADPLEEFLLAAVLFLISLPAVDACSRPGCLRLFVPQRGWHRWCSTSCGNRLRQARYRTKHEDMVSDGRHRRYAASVHKRHPKAKIGRRRRPRKGRAI